jgi:hypothetical protein
VPAADVADGQGQKIVFAGETRIFELSGISSWALISSGDGLVEIGYYS